MKISEMLEREDFYKINEETLNLYYGNDNTKQQKIYVYPHLNAIVCKNPSKEVINYLLCEYNLKSSIIKKYLIKIYIIMCMKTKGMMSSKEITIFNSTDKNTLIYPCNKKYRIFCFNKMEVDVINKYGFSNQNLMHEIEFRTKDDVPNFVPKIINVTNYGYKEKIISGIPLPRLTKNFEKYRDEAYQLIRNYGIQFEYVISGKQYVQNLLDKINLYLENEKINIENLADIIQLLGKKASQIKEVTITFSHGDLQLGNIWIENMTNKIYIIDWESWGERSTWYDYATLYYDLRSDLEDFLNSDFNELKKCIIILEDIIYRLEDISQIPYQFRKHEFDMYIKKLSNIINRFFRKLY